MKTIALYGYGHFGKRASESFRLYWGGEYEVTAIYDKALAGETDKYWSLKVRKPERLKEDYGTGIFEAVMVCINFRYLKEPVVKQLEELGIPVFIPGREADIAGPEAFLQDDNPGLSINRTKYSLHVFKNMLGAVADFSKSYYMFLFNEAGSLFVDNYKKYIHDFEPEIFLYPFRLRNPLPERVYLEGDYCLLLKPYAFNYWHFTFDIADGAYLLEQAGYRGKYIYMEYPYTKELLLLLGISPDRLISSKVFEIHRVYKFERLFVVNHRNLWPMQGSTEVLPEMAAWIQNNRLKADPESPKKIYVKRTGIRKLLIDDGFFRKIGYTVVIPEEHSVQEQMNLFYNADIVISAHGANCTNYIYMKKGSVFLEIGSDRWPMDIFREVAGACGVQYLQIMGQSVESGENRNDVDFTIEEETLLGAVHQAEELFIRGKKLGFSNRK